MAIYDETQGVQAMPTEELNELRHRHTRLQHDHDQMAIHLREALMKDCARLERKCKEMADLLTQLQRDEPAPSVGFAVKGNW
jgi:hypothetical protein